MEIEFISNKLSNQEKNMRGYFNTSPEHKKNLTYKTFHNSFRYKVSRLLPAKLHTRRDAFAETDPPAGLSSTHIPILGIV